MMIKHSRTRISSDGAEGLQVQAEGYKDHTEDGLHGMKAN